MPEVPHPREQHGEPLFVGGGDDFFVAHGSAGLDDAGGAGFGGLQQTIGEGEECIGGDGAAGKVYEGRLPLIATTVDDHPHLRTLSQWATEHCPITVVHDYTGDILDLDADRSAVDAETGKIDAELLTSQLKGATGAAKGSVLQTAEGAQAILASGITTVVAARRLPLQLRLIQA